VLDAAVPDTVADPFAYPDRLVTTVAVADDPALNPVTVMRPAESIEPEPALVVTVQEKLAS